MTFWSPAGHRGVAQPVVHLELHTPDLAGACSFYASLCGWRPQEIASYQALDPGSRVSGGVVECGVARPLWLPYVEVPSIESATGRAESLGARVLLSPREGPAGWRSVVSEPSGGEIAFWQPKSPRQ
jgi:predicted enzyme related to lactoylglutathione lyase